MDYRFSEEQEMLRKTVREFLKRECPIDKIRKWDENDEFPREIFDKMRELGIMGLSTPPEYGGTAGTAIDYVIIIEELAKVSVALAFLFISCVVYGGEIISGCGSEEQKRFFLPKTAKGELVFAYGITEPNAGSDAAAAQTTAVKDGHNYVINGTKMFITGADIADYIVTLTRTDKSLPKHKGLTLFIVGTKSKGYSARPLKKLGGHGASACEVVFDNVVVPEENILGGLDGLNNGWSLLLKTLTLEHLEVAAFSLGASQTSFDAALQYAKERQQFGQPIGKFQAIGHMLAEMATELELCRQLVYYCAWLKSENLPCFKEICMAKLYATELSERNALQAMKIFGGYGYMMDYDVQRYVRDALIAPVGGGTSQIQKNMIARELGL